MKNNDINIDENYTVDADSIIAGMRRIRDLIREITNDGNSEDFESEEEDDNPDNPIYIDCIKNYIKYKDLIHIYKIFGVRFKSIHEITNINNALGVSFYSLNQIINEFKKDEFQSEV